jgi:hypothetical protein
MDMIRRMVFKPVAGFIAVSWSTLRFLRLLVLVQRAEQGEHALRMQDRPSRASADLDGD